MAARVMQSLTYSLFCHGTVKQCAMHMLLHTKQSFFLTDAKEEAMTCLSEYNDRPCG